MSVASFGGKEGGREGRRGEGCTWERGKGRGRREGGREGDSMAAANQLTSGRKLCLSVT